MTAILGYAASALDYERAGDIPTYRILLAHHDPIPLRNQLFPTHH